LKPCGAPCEVAGCQATCDVAAHAGNQHMHRAQWEGGHNHCWNGAPTCSGPLATHGVAVLRVARSADFALLTRYECDACHLARENAVASKQAKLDAAHVTSSHPPARIGTVPQVFGLSVGVWGARGMR